jgi:hypothetical protein
MYQKNMDSFNLSDLLRPFFCPSTGPLACGSTYCTVLLRSRARLPHSRVTCFDLFLFPCSLSSCTPSLLLRAPSQPDERSSESAVLEASLLISDRWTNPPMCRLIFAPVQSIGFVSFLRLVISCFCVRGAKLRANGWSRRSEDIAYIRNIWPLVGVSKAAVS